MNFRTITLLCFLALFSGSTMLHAQGSTKDGKALTWSHEITVVPGTVKTRSGERPAHTITVFETDAKTALELLRAEYTPISVSTGGKPLKVTGLKMPNVSPAPVDVFVTGTTDKKAKLARLSLAFMSSDSTSLEDSEELKRSVRELAVRLNKAVVQKQIESYEEQLEKTGKKLGDTQADAAKAEKKLNKATASLQKTKSKRAKIERQNATLHGSIDGLKRTFELSNESKDLKKLTKARSKLAKNERAQAKLMDQETKYSSSITKYQTEVDSHGKKAEDHSAGKDDAKRTIDDLKRKRDSIQ